MVKERIFRNTEERAEFIFCIISGENQADGLLRKSTTVCGKSNKLDSTQFIVQGNTQLPYTVGNWVLITQTH